MEYLENFFGKSNMVVEYNKEDEKSEMVDRIIEGLKNSDKSMRIFWMSYSNINLHLKKGTVEIKVEKYSFRKSENNKTEVYISSKTYVFKENTEMVKTYWKIVFYLTEDFEYIEDFKEETSEEYLWRENFDSIFQDNKYFYRTFEEIFYPELDLRKE